MSQPKPTKQLQLELITPEEAAKAPRAQCWKCPLNRRPFVPTYVPKEFDGVVFVAEAPGEKEVEMKRGLVGASGSLLAEQYNKQGGKFSAAARTNAVLCRPEGNRNPTDEELDCCAARLEYELQKMEPRAIVSLGRIAEKQLGALRPFNTPVIQSIHPAAILRRQAGLPALQQALRQIVKGKDPLYEALSTAPEVITITSKSQLVLELSQIQNGEWVAFDFETNNVNRYDRPYERIVRKQGSRKIKIVQRRPTGVVKADPILCLAFTTGIGYGWVIPDYLLYDTPGVVEVLNEFFARVKTIGHNGKFDVLFGEQVGLKLHVDVDSLFQHYAFCELPGTHGLKNLAYSEFGVNDYEKDLVQKYLNSRNDEYSKVPEKHLYQYAVWDVCITIALANRQKKRLQKINMWERPFLDLYMPANTMLTNVERRGVKIDTEHLELWRDLMMRRASIVQDQINSFALSKGQLDDFVDATVNLNSSKQVKHYLFDILGLPETPATRRTKPGSTDKDALKTIKHLHQAVELILEYRACVKMVTSYIDNMLLNVDVNGRVHTQYLWYGTVQGRMSSRSPALQTIPRGSNFYGRIIKAAFIPEEDMVFIDCDYDQAEVRVLAAVTGDPFLIGVCDRDMGLHDEVLQAVWGPKQDMDELLYKTRKIIVKAFNFGWAYGASPKTLRQALGDPATARFFMAKYEENMKVASEWREIIPQKAIHYGYLESATGRRRRTHFHYVDNWGRDAYGTIPTEFINFPIQSGASDCTSKSAIRLDSEGHRVLLLVHDELVVEVPKTQAEYMQDYVAQVMEEEAAKIFPQVRWKTDPEIKDRWLKKPSDKEIEQWMQGVKKVQVDLGEDQNRSAI